MNFSKEKFYSIYCSLDSWLDYLGRGSLPNAKEIGLSIDFLFFIILFFSISFWYYTVTITDLLEVKTSWETIFLKTQYILYSVFQYTTAIKSTYWHQNLSAPWNQLSCHSLLSVSCSLCQWSLSSSFELIFNIFYSGRQLNLHIISLFLVWGRNCQ